MLRHRILLLALAAGTALPLVVFAAVGVVLFGREQEGAVQGALRQLARTSIAAIDRQLSDQLSALTTLAATVHLENGSGVLGEQARQVLSVRNDWLAVVLIDAADRRTRFEMTKSATLPSFAADPDSVDLVVMEQRPVIGALSGDRSSTGEAVVSIYVPVDDAGRVDAVLMAVVRAAAYAEVLLQREVPTDWTAAILDRQHRIVARTRAQEEFVGTLATQSLRDELGRAPENFFFALNKEGDKVYTAFTRSEFSGWVAAVGAPARAVEPALQRSFWGSVGGGAGALALSMLLGGLLVRSYGRRQEAERRLHALEVERRAERRLGDIAANFPGLIFQRVLHRDGRLSYPYIGGTATELLPPGQPNNQPVDFEAVAAALVPEDRERWKQALDQSATVLGSYSRDGRVQLPDGRQRWVRTMAHTRREPDGSIVWDGVTLDITDVTEARAALEASLTEKEILLREIHHRVKNNMQVISSLIQLEARRLDNLGRERLETVAQRISVMGRIHDQLYRSERLTAIDFAEHLEQLGRSVATLHSAGEEVEITIEAEHLQCEIDVAMPLGLIAHELLSNSIKHAFADRAGGRITVALRRLNHDQVELTVCDNGPGMTADGPPSSSGLGLQLVRALCDQIGARMEVGVAAAGGTRTSILIPAEDFV